MFQAYVSLCDLLIFFAEQIASADATLRPLVLDADPQLFDLLNAAVQEFVFSHQNYGKYQIRLTLTRTYYFQIFSIYVASYGHLLSQLKPLNEPILVTVYSVSVTASSEFLCYNPGEKRT